MIKKIDHIGIIVDDLNKAKKVYGEEFGFELLNEQKSEEYQSAYAFYQCGNVMIELICPTGAGSNLEYLEKNGNGIHHICYEVDDIDQEINHLRGVLDFKDPRPEQGAFGSRVCFLEPASTMGIETELVEKSIISNGY